MLLSRSYITQRRRGYDLHIKKKNWRRPSGSEDKLIQSQKRYRETDTQTAHHINSPPDRKSVYAPQHNRTHEREASRSESSLTSERDDVVYW